ncbi:MAG: hypothetical protein Q7R64_02950, partial [bacterium]|nr:hypothetical protein [bacterium]
MSPLTRTLHFALWSRIGLLPRFFVTRWQLGELKKTLRHAYHNVPFYRELWDAYRVRPEDIRTSRDLRRLPLTSKSLFRSQDLEPLIDRSFHDRYVRWTETSGSTGEPFRIPRTSPARFFQDNRYNAFYWYHALLRRGVTYEDIKNKFRVAHIMTKPERRLSEWYLYRSTASIREDPKEVITALRDFQPDVLKAGPTVLVELARSAEQLQCGKLPTPRYLISYGESFNTTQRKVIEDAFGTR